jgi:hypothetical protein
VLKEMKTRNPDAGDNDLIFPGGSADGSLAKGSILSFIRGTLKWNIDITAHGFRATLRTWAQAQRPPYDDIFIKAQFDQLSLSDLDGLRHRRPSVADVHYGHGDRPEMSDPTIEGPGARREMIDSYGEYLDSYKGK